MAKATYQVVRPDGTIKRRVSARPYTHARTLDFGQGQSSGSPYLTTFHGSEELANRPHPDFPGVPFTVQPVETI
jgi:hypothetical protein